MDLRNCKRCGKVFAYVSNPLCPSCIEKEEEEFKLVRDYVAANDKPTVAQTSRATGVDEKVILKFVREGRLLKAGYKWEVLTCQTCGAPIASGRYCERCSNALAKELSEAAAAGAKDEKKDTRRSGEDVYVNGLGIRK